MLRNYYTLMEDKQHAYGKEQEKLMNGVVFEDNDFKLVDTRGFEAPVVGLQVDFPPYPCFVTGLERRTHLRPISKVFNQPNECKETDFIKRDPLTQDEEHVLFQRVSGFNISEYTVLEDNQVLSKLRNDNPYHHKIDKIFDENIFKTQFYHLYYQNYLRYSLTCQAIPALSMKSFAQAL